MDHPKQDRGKPLTASAPIVQATSNAPSASVPEVQADRDSQRYASPEYQLNAESDSPDAGPEPNSS